jgi:transmembrane sensor
MKYVYYTEEELILDESFQNWVRQTNAGDVAFWNEWLSRHPQHQLKLENARQMLHSLSFSELPLPEAEVNKAWMELQGAIRQRNKSVQALRAPEKQIKKVSINRWWYRTAAVLAVVAISGTIYWLNTSRLHTHHTLFGQTATISLPDGSQVILNGNSTLKYPSHWNYQKAREVWLEGEAFFAVTKKNNTGAAKFIVHIPDMDVEVLGTKFNVYHRKQKGRIVLNCGEVRVNITHADKNKVATLVMKPGDLVEKSERNNKLIRKKVNPEIYSAWKNNRLIFDNTSLAEIGEMIEMTYGKRVVFEDGTQANRKLTGTIPTDNLDILIMTLSKSFNLSIAENKNQLIVKSGSVPMNRNISD